MVKIKRKEKNKNTEEAKAIALKKEREKQRKKMIRTKYGQAPLRHAKKGIKSCFYAAFSVFFMFLIIASSYLNNGDIGISIGLVGIFVFVLSVMGTITGVQGFKERDKNYTTCKVGTAVNGFILLCMCVIFIRGLM